MEQSSYQPKKRSGTVAGMKEGLKKATTEMLVLFLLKQKSMYAYEMIQEMARLSDGMLRFNTLYLAIYRLQEDGITAEYHRFVETLDKMMAADGKIYEDEND